MLTPIVFSSCASVEPVSQPQPKPSNHQAQIKQYMGFLLKDPESAVYKYWRGPTLKETTRGPMWGSFFSVKAKNSFGGFSGYKYYTTTFKDGRIQSVYNPASGIR